MSRATRSRGRAGSAPAAMSPRLSPGHWWRTRLLVERHIRGLRQLWAETERKIRGSRPGLSVCRPSGAMSCRRPLARTRLDGKCIVRAS